MEPYGPLSFSFEPVPEAQRLIRYEALVNELKPVQSCETISLESVYL